MDVFLERCAGLDVHQASVVCCVLIGATPGRKPQKLQRSFGTTTRELDALRARLAEQGVTHIGMESTGVYWKPMYAVLEGHFDGVGALQKSQGEDGRMSVSSPRLPDAAQT